MKKGLIYCPDGKRPWAKHSALQPTPIIMEDDKTLRIYAGFRDEYGVSRVGYVDVAVHNPSKVLAVSKKPVLDIGVPGTFDDNGVVPAAIIRKEGNYLLYYAGYQIPQKVKFLAFGGLAISKNGETFTRYKQVPVMDRSDHELYFRVLHSLIYENGIWKVWYGSGSKFIHENGKILPVYDIKYVESKDGVSFNTPGRVCIRLEGDEYRVGRPYVVKDSGTYKMFYGTATASKGYRLGYAESKNGVDWKRKDNEIGIDVSEKGWDSKMLAFPAIVRHDGKVYMFYNGNDMGKEGFGYAVLEEW